MRQIWRSTSRRRHRADLDDGFTLIEVVVALGLLAMMMVSMAALFYSAMKVAVSSNIRTRATAVATRELESFRVGKYDVIGFYNNQPGFVPTFEGMTTVSLGPTAPADALYKPTGTVTVEDSTFSIKRYAVWVDAPVPSAPSKVEAYKKTIVIISWTDQGTARSVRQESIIYPGGLGTYSGPGSGMATTTTSTTPIATPGPPVLNTATVPPDPAGRSQIDLTWSPTTGPIHHYVVEWSLNTAFSPAATSPNQPASATSFSIVPLSSSTTYYFRVFAYGDAAGTVRSAASNTLSATTLADTGPTCTVGSLNMTTTASPPSSTKIYLQSNGKLGVNIDAVVNLSGTCSGTFVLQGKKPNGTALGSWAMGGSGTTRSVWMPVANDKWDIGLHQFTVMHNASPTPAVRSLLICAKNNKPSTNPNQC